MMMLVRVVLALLSVQSRDVRLKSAWRHEALYKLVKLQLVGERHFGGVAVAGSNVRRNERRHRNAGKDIFYSFVF